MSSTCFTCESAGKGGFCSLTLVDLWAESIQECYAPGLAEFFCPMDNDITLMPMSNNLLCKVCSVGTFMDSDPQFGVVTGKIHFGPNQKDGFVDESLLWGYRLSFIDDCGADLGEIGKVPSGPELTMLSQQTLSHWVIETSRLLVYILYYIYIIYIIINHNYGELLVIFGGSPNYCKPMPPKCHQTLQFRPRHHTKTMYGRSRFVFDMGQVWSWSGLKLRSFHGRCNWTPER
ncbi:PseudoU_synth_2 domain-containing protein [Durusdinium trenchii]|uniref:PseudoU_synth_2 domain-containing protein n=1 Tax=Durusdinium trenchii TaxID=1381693 RepID=A0ABP0JLA5_9DINO